MCVIQLLFHNSFNRYAIGNAERSMFGKPKIGWLDHLANDTQQWYKIENDTESGGPELRVSGL